MRFRSKRRAGQSPRSTGPSGGLGTALTGAEVAELGARLEERIAAYRAARALVAFSGGVDSSVVLALAVRALGPSAVEAVTAVSPSYPSGELEAAADVARSIGAHHRVIDTHEVERDAYARNDGMRCFHCKTELYVSLGKLARAEETLVAGAVVLAGANADDLGEFRPGLRAAEQLGVRNPLMEERVGKEAVRALARSIGLEVADKPALACLSSRVAYGVRISHELLSRIDQAEQAVRSLGFRSVRVRHFGKVASIEVSPEEVDRLVADPRLPVLGARLHDLGWEDVAVDMDGYRPGRMNETLGADPD
jgi:uncharacterized protein